MSALLSLLVVCCSATLLHGAELEEFTNPVMKRSDGDWGKEAGSLLRVGDKYYMSFTYLESANGETYSKIFLLESNQLTKFNLSVRSVPFQVSSDKNIKATHLFAYDGSLYIYFSMQGLMHVIKAENIEDPMGRWSAPIRLFDYSHTDNENEQGIMMVHDGKLYFLISTLGVEAINEIVTRFVIYLMDSPTQVASTKPTYLSKDVEDWECSMGGDFKFCFNEYPSVVYKNGVTYLVFTAGDFFNDNSSLGYMKISSGQDPLQVAHWQSHSGPVFTSNIEEDVKNICCSTFTTSQDGSETWMMYFAASHPYTEADMTPRLEKISWNKGSGEPKFPPAHGYNQPQPVPSGQKNGDVGATTTRQPEKTTPISNGGLAISGMFQLGYACVFLILIQ